jgi:phosphoribosylanthranilate isomerase
VSRVRIKVCGLTDAHALDAAVDAGADAIGFVFAESPRRVALDRAEVLVERVPALVSRVAVLKNPSQEHAAAVASCAWFSLMQCDVEDQSTLQAAGVRTPRLPVVRVGTKPFELMMTARMELPAYILVEGPRSGVGETVDWTLVATLARRTRLILAGGLNPDNVAHAIHTVRPFAVDVSSGVESAPGKKDPIKIKDFIAAVRDAERSI